MICYQCGSQLGSGHICLRCGADVSIYRKIVRASNGFYNAGLEKARLRDLTGAVEALSKSLQLNKRNTNARNLLGLIYFEMGEVVEALCQWVISKNLQPEDNLADEYLRILQEDRNSLESMNQAIKKFNQALYQAKNEGRDLAIIQLKRVLKQHPHLLKAYQLLALLYIEDQDYSRAGRLLKKALKIDQGNTLCLKYSKMIRGKLSKPGKESRDEMPPSILDLEEADTPDVIAPRSRQKSEKVRLFLAVLAGMAIALCFYQFVVLRTINRNANLQENQEIAAYDNKLADKELEIQTLQSQADQMEKERDDLSAKLNSYQGDNGILTQYDALLEIVDMYMQEDKDTDKLAEEFNKLQSDSVQSQAYQDVYAAMKQYVMVDRVEEVFREGQQLVDTDYYTQAIPVFERCLEMNPDFDKAIYYLGVCYEHRHDIETANTYFQQLVDNYPNSEYYDQALSRDGVSEYPGRTPGTGEGNENPLGGDNNPTGDNPTGDDSDGVLPEGNDPEGEEPDMNDPDVQ
ncbi:MAG: tetratricopeptide repeat protein [Clostridiales bacterium]|nr:tetratricopeptide repeat protein [Clostridiales bacterium]